MSNIKPPIPCHLITGPLGVGKTTTVLHYLKQQAGREFIAVLVNDFGPMGMDDAILEGELGDKVRAGTELLMVPGGCICCSAAPGMIAALQKLATLPRVDRILIEPSGMAMTGDMLDLLYSLKQQHHLELRPTITLLDVREVDKQAYQRMPYFYRMFEAADILVGHRADLATPMQLEKFTQWADSLYPPKLRIITTHHGQLPTEVFELTKKEEPQATGFQVLSLAPGHEPPMKMKLGTKAATQHTVEGGGATLSPLLLMQPPMFKHEGQAGGVRWDATLRFDAQGMLEALHQIVREGFQGVKVERLKGVLNTDEGWQLMEIARGDVFSRPTDYRRDNRIDWITLEGNVDAAAFKAHLLSLARPPVY